MAHGLEEMQILPLPGFLRSVVLSLETALHSSVQDTSHPQDAGATMKNETWEDVNSEQSAPTTLPAAL